MKKSLAAPFVFWLSAELVLFAAFVFADSAAAFGAFIVLFLVAALSYAVCFYQRKHISAEVVLPPTAEKNSEMSGKLIIKNSSRLPILKLICRLESHNHLTGEKTSTVLSLSAAPNAGSETVFSLSSKKCGYITAKAESIWITDLFGFLPLRVREFSSLKAKTTVLPETFASEIVFGAVPPLSEESESYSPDRKGNDFSETFQLREYAEGDSMKQIHWKLSEKLDKLIVRDPSLPVEKNILLFWDKTANTIITPGEMDAMAEVTASVAQSFCRMGIKFILGWNDGKKTSFEDIKDTGDVVAAIPRLIKSKAEKDTEKFSEGLGNLRFSKIVFVAKEISDAAEALSTRSSVNFLLCGTAASANNAVVFSPESYAEDLKMLELTT